MLRSILAASAAAAIGLTAAISAANAQAVEEEEMSSDPAISDEEQSVSQKEVETIAPPTNRPAIHKRTRVYGWTAARPTSCGEFKYWDGRACMDARSNPPDVTP